MLREQIKTKEKSPEEQGNKVVPIQERLVWTKKPIAPRDLFKPRSIKPGEPEKEIHRVLLVGATGTGKTILSRKLAYQWSQGAWGQEFEAVYLLPVRNLQQSQYDGTRYNTEQTLATAIVNNCFVDIPDEETSYNRLRSHIKEELQKTSTLVILDGLDERAGASAEILRQSQTGSRKLLMLSRPYGIETERRLATIEVEHAGFNDEQLKAYVQEEVSDDKLAKELLGYIHKHENIRTIAHVPVNLQLLCASWQDEEDDTQQAAQPGSLPRLYRKFSEHIWRRYRERKEQLGQPVPDREALFDALGQVALGALQAGEVLIGPGLIDEALGDTLDAQASKRAFRDSGFLLLQSTDQRCYQFPHPTFQEYFAGHALAKQLLSIDEDEQERVRKLFSDRKYESQYGQTLSFMAGEVSRAQGVAGLKTLLRHMEVDKEIVGVQHLRLQLRIIHEWLCMAPEEVEDDLNMLEREFQVLDALEQWFLRAFAHVRQEAYRDKRAGRKLLDLLTSSLQTFWTVANHAPALFQRLQEATQDKSEHVRAAALQALPALIQAAPERIQESFPSIQEALKDSNWMVRESALQVLPTMVQAAPGHYAEASPSIQEALKDDDWWVRAAALQALSALIQAAPERAQKFFPSTQKALKDDSETVRSVLRSLSALIQAAPEQAQKFFPSIQKALEDGPGRIRAAVLTALPPMIQAAPEQAQEIFPGIQKALEDNDWLIRAAALAALPPTIQAAPELAQEAFRGIQKALEDKSWRIREAALRAISALIQASPAQAPKFFPSIQKYLKDSSGWVRCAALQTLGSLNTLDLTSVTPSHLATKDESEDIRIAAPEARKQGDQAAPSEGTDIISILKEATQDLNENIQEAAIVALGKVVQFTPEKALAIIKILKETADQGEDTDIQEAAIAALGKVAQVAPDKTPAIIQTLQKAAAQGEDADAQRATIETLGKVAQIAPGQAPAIIGILQEAAAHSKDAGVQRAIIEALEKIAQAAPSEGPSIIPSLIEVAEDQQQSARQAAIEALEKISLQPLLERYWAGQDPRLIPHITTRLYHTPLVVRILEQGQQQAVLYGTAGRPQTWEKPQEVVQRFVNLIQPRPGTHQKPGQVGQPPQQVTPTESSGANKTVTPPYISSSIALSKLNHFVERPHITSQLEAALQAQGVCVLCGFGGTGKSTLAAHYGHKRRGIQIVRWIEAENSSKLQEGYEHLAQELQIDDQTLAKQLLSVDPGRYRQELARAIYGALARYKQTTLLILDNTEDASLIEDYLLPRTSTVQVIVTTRNAEAFVGKYEQLPVDAFSQEEGQRYLEARLKQMKRAYTSEEVNDLLGEIGLVPQKLNLAASYLQANRLVTTAQYIARLQTLKQAGIKQQGKLALPEVSLGLEKLTKESQQLMQYGAYLDADFIPRSLVSALLEEEDDEQLSRVMADLASLSLMQVIHNGGEELGLQVHREVQASCRVYDGWTAEAALGSSGAILARLAQVLASQMPWVSSNPDEHWQQARLYVPHVAKVLSRLNSSDAEPSVVVAKLLNCMGQYSKEVVRNYPAALEYQKQALQIYQDRYQGDHPDVARSWSELGTTLSQLGRRQEALEHKQQALEMRKRLLKDRDRQEDPELAHALNSVGELLSHLGRHQEALQYKQEGLFMRKCLYKGQDHPDVARSLNSVGISLEDLKQLPEALLYKKESLEMRQRLASDQNHPDTAHSLNNVGETLIKLGQAEEGIEYCQQGLDMRECLFKGQDHPYMAQSLNGVGLGYTALGRYEEAATHYQQAVEVALRVFKQAHPQLTKYLGHLIETLPKLEEGKAREIKTKLVPPCIEVLGEEDTLTKDLLTGQ
ncbi:MAG: sister chromatid cohesion protein PDS5 [Bacteroidota bacterium]